MEFIMNMFFLNRSIFLIANLVLLYIFLEPRKSHLFQSMAFILTWITVTGIHFFIISNNSLLFSYAIGSLYLIPCILIFKETYRAKIFVFYMVFSLTQFIYLIFNYLGHFLSPAIPQIFVFLGLMLELVAMPLIKRYIKPPIKDILKILDQHNAMFALFPILSFLLLTNYAVFEKYQVSTFINLILTTVLLFFSYYLIAISITATKRQQELEFLSMTDSLTGLNNRRYLDQKINQEYDQYLNTSSKFALISADIDLFKNINDLYGHDRGDIVLKSIAEDIRKSIRSYDRVARWGGEEFLILLPATNRAQAILLAERIRKKVEAHEYEFDNNKAVSVTLTLGVSVVGVSDSIDELKKKADIALYYGKQKSRNCVISFNEIKNEVGNDTI